MRITDSNPIKTAAEIRRKARAGSSSSSSFADLLDAVSSDNAQSTGNLSDVSAPADVSMMLALQEISDDELNRKKLILQGKNLLDELDKLRQQLLIGRVPLSTLQNLGKELAVQRVNISDPALLSLMDDIELRAAVELAKLEMAEKGNREG
ncbi:MAG: flagellar assembly protein FliX [Rickettsiales bacterium]|jgi:hypothetical protein|nr:flagellar assembly protein FliX [Rickettsiales bacterium]